MKSVDQSVLAPTPLSWEVNGLQIHGLSWGDPTNTPLLALHGWLDNAASFSFLAPFLTRFYVVALDLTGHGLSDNRSADASYHIWDDLPEIAGVMDALGWGSFALLGHSRGAIISTLLASTFPERVDALVLLDAVVPGAVEEAQFPAQMRLSLNDKAAQNKRKIREFSSVEDAMAPRLRKGLSEDAARAIVERNLRAGPSGYTWTTDGRLHTASAVKMSAGQIEAVLQNLSMPTLLVLAEQSQYRAPNLTELAQRHIANLNVATVPGGHHFHMEENLDELARRLDTFINSCEQEMTQ